MHAEQRERAARYLAGRGVTQALFANPGSVTWLTGFAPPRELGPSPFAGRPPLVWYDGSQFTLVVLDSDAEKAAASGCAVMSYAGYAVEEPLAGAVHLAGAVRALVSSSPSRGRVGIEERDFPAALWTVVRGSVSHQVDMTPIDDWLRPLRVVKTDEELAVLRAAFALTDVGQAAARRAVRAGQREIDVWLAVEDAVQRAAGQRVAIGNDCVVGYRDNNIGGWPRDLPIRPHDAVVVDVSTVWHGYWSDSCATYYAGAPTARQRDMHQTVARALEAGLSLVKPDALARDIDRAVREVIAAAGYPVYPHHTGHSVGVSGHEDPRIVPYNTQPLEPGMVLMLEPGIYYPGETGVRLEDAVLVTAQGAEVLTRHDKSLP